MPVLRVRDSGRRPVLLVVRIRDHGRHRPRSGGSPPCCSPISSASPRWPSTVTRKQVKRLVDSCFERLVDDITAFGGRVDKILGDGILALFGAPVAHEDDAERAVRAGAAHAGRRSPTSSARPACPAAPASSMRVGINTGEVLVGTLAGTEYTAMGDVVNTASRLQSAAPPGGILVGQTTYALTSQAIHFEPAGELDAKGREQSIKAWLAVEATAPPGSRSRRGRNGPLDRSPTRIGHRTRRARPGQLRKPQRAAGHLRRERRGQVAPGRRADRLPPQLGRRRSPRGRVRAVRRGQRLVPDRQRAVPLSRSRPHTVRSTTSETWPATGRRSCSRASTNPRSIGWSMCSPIFSAIRRASTGSTPRRRARSIHSAVSRVFELRSQERPVVLSINDLHWADSALIGLLEHLVTSLSRHRFALITAMRPGSDVIWPPHTERVTVVSLNLQPLGQSATEELAAELLSDQCADPELLTALYERSGGNPLFLHELAALAAAGGGIRELPNSLRALIIARLDQLSPEQRQIIENAATLGTSGSIASLQTFADELGQRFDPANVRELDDLGLLEVRGRRWEFRSDSVRDAAYQTLTKAARARRHAGVAKAMAHLPTGLDDRAHHTATAAELVKEIGPVEGVSRAITDEAIQLLTDAAERADDNGSLRVAVRHASRALELLPPGAEHEERRVQLQLTRAGALLDLRDFDAARTDLDRRVGQRGPTRRCRCAGRCPPPAREHASRGQPTRRGRAWNSARPSTSSARSIVAISSPAPYGPAVSSSCSADR